ncbi:hypothetical protein [Streptomyces sp. NPDC005438]|uniref:hypothetical protein n=1 Tax=Streptomyces sp. NPDC005438 TaxID=3156880 RepID=UPI0033BB8D52
MTSHHRDGSASPTSIPSTRQAAGPRRPPLGQRLAELRGPRPPRPLDARALAALAANPGCRRRALLDGAGVDKGALAQRLGAPAVFGQSQFAFARGHTFEARAKAEEGASLVRLLAERTGERAPAGPDELTTSHPTGPDPAARVARTAHALREATARGGWSLLDHPLLELAVADSTVHLEPDALAVHPDGRWTVIEIKSFPILDGSAEPSKVGAAARQAAVYALALRQLAPSPETVCERALLVCPRDFGHTPTAALIDVRRQLATTRRQLARLTRLEEIARALPEGVTLDPECEDPEALRQSVGAVPAAYAPECLASCELAFHCRESARATGEVTVLGRGVRGELGGLRTVDQVARCGSEDRPGDPTAEQLRRAARLRDEAMREARDLGLVPEGAR